MRRILWGAFILLLVSGLVVVGAVQVLGRGVFGQAPGAGEVTPHPIPSHWIEERAAAQRAARSELSTTVAGGKEDPGRSEEAKQILFGDLHAHTTYSFDAFMMSLPMLQGEGAHPPADACDFARYCAGLDFWSINDHAEGLTPHQWEETKRSVRECQALAGDPEAPDLVSFLGWEWTQIGSLPENHYGHKNVVLLDLEEESIPRRPIASRPGLIPTAGGGANIGPAIRTLLIATSPGSEDRQPYHDFARLLHDRGATPACEEGVPVRDLPNDCQERAPTPGELFAKLDDWGFPYLVIPHGNTWGIYTPPGTSWDKQLAAHREPGEHEFLFEIFSGHGNSEEYRDWRAVELAADGSARCPERTADYLPSCWRAGEIIRERCMAAGESAAECESRAREARQYYVEGGTEGHVTVPGVTPEDWLEAGQCLDCFMPAFSYRPGGSAQYALAIGDFEAESGRSGEAQGRGSALVASPKRFQFGFIGSSDNHTGRPGTGYKEMNRREMTEAGEGGFGSFRSMLGEEPEPRSVSVDSATVRIPEFERFASYLGTGGLVAVHSSGRSRHAIWDALQRKEVYGTSGERMLLWFELVRSAEEPVPMGAEAVVDGVPRFRVRAVGSFRQKPGCPEHSSDALSPERLHHLCRDECYNPSDQRKSITRVEVVRIRPQRGPEEPISGLIEDPWRVLACEPDPSGCVVEFEDPEFPKLGRDVLYYVRAVQERSQAINASGLRCEYDDSGECVSASPCYGDTRTDYEEDCLAETEERAWSSPIYLGPAVSRASAGAP